ncbi:MAG TPA: type II toxin-antitoxin system RelE/ParE family toxin, partial [Solirubrobacteraceae bacterium]|nr:type II toxin-antitoxin system RelE/ParE family toxin [Solirubrobacteraceae bacterium]
RGLNSLRVGSYRIIYQLADGNKIVRVAAIRHRSTSLHREELEADWERAKDGGTPEPIEPLP